MVFVKVVSTQVKLKAILMQIVFFFSSFLGGAGGGGGGGGGRRGGGELNKMHHVQCESGK